MLFKEFGGVDAWPDLPATPRTPTRSSPRSRRSPRASAASTSRTSPRRAASRSNGACSESLDIPVFHDDQHGTAVVVLAAFLNALRVVGKRIEDVRVVVTGVGAAGVAVDRDAPGGRRAPTDRLRQQGALYRGRPGLTPVKELSRRAHQSGQLRRHARRGAGRRRRVHRALRPRHRDGAEDSQRWRRDADRLRDGQPDPRGDAGRDRRRSPRSSPPAAPTSPTRSTTCSPSPASSAARWTCGRADHRADGGRRRPRDRRHRRRRRAGADYIVPSVFNREVVVAVAAAVARQRTPTVSRAAPGCRSRAPAELAPVSRRRARTSGSRRTRATYAAAAWSGLVSRCRRPPPPGRRADRSRRRSRAGRPPPRRRLTA